MALAKTHKVSQVDIGNLAVFLVVGFVPAPKVGIEFEVLVPLVEVPLHLPTANRVYYYGALLRLGSHSLISYPCFLLLTPKNKDSDCVTGSRGWPLSQLLIAWIVSVFFSFH